MKKYPLAVTSIFLFLAAFTTQAEQTATAGYKYTNDWALVSAPPPPGPYRAVNIDPRVPSQDVVPPMHVKIPQGMDPAEIPPAALANAPAAGIPAKRPAQALQPPVPGQYNRMMPPRPEFTYPPGSRYPGQSGYPGYRNVPTPGYYNNPSFQNGVPVREQQVPPPPVYDAMNSLEHDVSEQGNR